MAKESSGLLALAASGLCVALLAVTPSLIEFFGWRSVGIFWLFVPLALLPWRSRGRRNAAAPDSQERAEQRSPARRKKARKPKERDNRGLKFHNFKICNIQQPPEQSSKSSGLARTPTVDENGMLWEFKETMGVRTISVDPAAYKEPDEQASVELDPKLQEEIVHLLRRAGLPEKLPEVRQWCIEMGAGFLSEVCDNASELISALGLSPTAAARLESACSSVLLKRASAEKVGLQSQSSRQFQEPGLLERATSLAMETTSSLAQTLSVNLAKTFSRPPSLTRRTSTKFDELERVALDRGLTPTLSTTRTTSYINGVVTCQEVKVGVIDDAADEESESEDEDEGELLDDDKVRGKALFTRAARAVLFGVRAQLLGKRRREEYEMHAVQVSREEVTPHVEEAKLDGRSVLTQLAEFKAPIGVECLTLIVPAGTVAIESLQAQVTGKRARKYIQLVAASLQGDDLPKNGLGVFLKVYGKDDAHNELVAIEPPVPMKKFSLSDGPVFATELLTQLYKDGLGLACAVISGDEALLYRLFADHGRVEARIQPRLQKRQKKGGQSALRIARLAEEVRAAYVRIVAERMNQEFTSTEGINVDMTFIGGSRELADNLHASDWLDYRIQKTMRRAPEIKETDHVGEILRKAMALKHEKEEGSMLSVLRECEDQAHTDLAAYGLKEVIRRIEEYNIATLMYAVGAGLPTHLEQQATGIGGAKVIRVESGRAHEELIRKWGGAFAICRWKPEDYDEEDKGDT